VFVMFKVNTLALLLLLVNCCQSWLQSNKTWSTFTMLLHCCCRCYQTLLIYGCKALKLSNTSFYAFKPHTKLTAAAGSCRLLTVPHPRKLCCTSGVRAHVCECKHFCQHVRKGLQTTHCKHNCNAMHYIKPKSYRTPATMLSAQSSVLEQRRLSWSSYHQLIPSV
jgi:hypothetical protein